MSAGKPICFTGPLDRSTYLGGSDVAAVLGVSPWCTPVELWEQKTGRAPKETPDAAQQRRFDRGHKLEPFIRDMVIDKLREQGHEAELIDWNLRYTDAEHPFLSCEIDFELLLDGEHINCDAKSVSGFARKKWGAEETEDVPIEYAAQFMHGLGLTGRRRCLVAALRSFDDVDIYWTLRDDETIAAIRERMVAFWTLHVLPGVPPDAVTLADVRSLYPQDNGSAVEATQDVADKVAQLAETKARIKELEQAEEALQFDIVRAIEPASALTYCGREIASWRAQTARRLDQKALKEQVPDVAARFTTTSSTRVLRLKKESRA